MNEHKQEGWFGTQQSYFSKGIWFVIKDVFSFTIFFFFEIIPSIAIGINDSIMEKLGYCRHELEIVSASTSTEVVKCLKCSRAFILPYYWRMTKFGKDIENHKWL